MCDVVLDPQNNVLQRCELKILSQNQSALFLHMYKTYKGISHCPKVTLNVQ